MRCILNEPMKNNIIHQLHNYLQSIEIKTHIRYESNYKINIPFHPNTPISIFWNIDPSHSYPSKLFKINTKIQKYPLKLDNNHLKVQMPANLKANSKCVNNLRTILCLSIGRLICLPQKNKQPIKISSSQYLKRQISSMIVQRN